MSIQPLVSVLISTFNHEQFIAQCLDSVLAQQGVKLEVIVCDDASSDRTPAIVTEYASRFPGKIIALLNSKNAGITPVWNSMLARCSGKYVATFSGDDIMLPGKLSKQVAVMQRDDAAVLVYHDVDAFHSESNATLYFSNHGPGSHPAHSGSASEVLWKLIATGNDFIAATSVLLRRSSIPARGFEWRLPIVADWYMWICVLAESGEQSSVQFIPEILSRYRRHSRNVSNELQIEDIAVTLALVEARFPPYLGAVRRGRAWLYYWIAARLYRGNQILAARRYLVASLRTGFVSWKVPLRMLQSLIPGIRHW
jgi:glycosyltransferase involved in cell wall biosynthesis